MGEHTRTKRGFSGSFKSWTAALPTVFRQTNIVLEALIKIKLSDQLQIDAGKDLLTLYKIINKLSRVSQ